MRITIPLTVSTQAALLFYGFTVLNIGNSRTLRSLEDFLSQEAIVRDGGEWGSGGGGRDCH